MGTRDASALCAVVARLHQAIRRAPDDHWRRETIAPRGATSVWSQGQARAATDCVWAKFSGPTTNEVGSRRVSDINCTYQMRARARHFRESEIGPLADKVAYGLGESALWRVAGQWPARASGAREAGFMPAQ